MIVIPIKVTHQIKGKGNDLTVQKKVNVKKSIKTFYQIKEKYKVKGNFLIKGKGVADKHNKF